MPAAEKIELKEAYAQILEDKPNFILTRYSGLDVGQMTDLRAKLREKGVEYRVVKNNVFRLAVLDRGEVKGMPENPFTGPIGVAFAGDDLPIAAKVLKDYAKDEEKFSLVAGVMEAHFYDESKVGTLASLPTREELLAKLAASLNGPATEMAGLLNNIMASLARAIKAVGEKNG